MNNDRIPVDDEQPESERLVLTINAIQEMSRTITAIGKGIREALPNIRLSSQAD